MSNAKREGGSVTMASSWRCWPHVARIQANSENTIIQRIGAFINKSHGISKAVDDRHGSSDDKEPRDIRAGAGMARRPFDRLRSVG